MPKELNIFVENRPGRLRSVAEILSLNKINVRTMTLQDRGEFGLMKMIVDKPQAAHLALQDKGFACALKDILAIALKDKPGSFLDLADTLYKHKSMYLTLTVLLFPPANRRYFVSRSRTLKRSARYSLKKGLNCSRMNCTNFKSLYTPQCAGDPAITTLHHFKTATKNRICRKYSRG